MIITDEYNSDYVYKNNKLNETRNIIENTLLEYERKYGGKYSRSVKVKCVAKFSDKRINETKNFTIERYNIIREVNTTMKSTKWLCIFLRLYELKNIIEGESYENVIDISLKNENYPRLWKIFFFKIANDRDNGSNTFNQHHRETHFF